MTLAIESFEVSWLIEFVIWGIEISCFFFFLETITRNSKYFSRDEGKDIDLFYEFPYFPYRYLISSMKTFYKEKIIRIFSRTKNSFWTSIVDFLFKLVIVGSLLYLFLVESFVPLLSNNSGNNLSLSLQKCNCNEWNIVKEFSLQLSTPLICRILFFV